MATVVLRPNESGDSLLRRFRKKVVKSGILSTVRQALVCFKSETRRVEQKKSMRRIKRRHSKMNS